MIKRCGISAVKKELLFKWFSSSSLFRSRRDTSIFFPECYRTFYQVSRLNCHNGRQTTLSSSEQSNLFSEEEEDESMTFNETDPLQTLERVAQKSMKEVHAIQEDEKNASHQASDTSIDSEGGRCHSTNSVESSRQRRKLRRRRTVDNILGDVLNDALRLRDLGKKPNMDFIYKRTQERLYEEEYGKKPPSAKEHAAKYIPFPPDFHLYRILPLFPSSNANNEANVSSSSRYESDCMETTMMFREIHDDPWPERAITPTNPVWTKGEEEADKRQNNGMKLKEWEAKLFLPRPGFDVVGEFLDAADELAYWEAQLLNFIRIVPLTQRRCLPYLHEWYRIFVHRTIRAERRYTATRDAALASVKASSSLFKRTEEVIDRVRAVYAEAHRSLSSANYDPLRVKKSVLANFMKMSHRDFAEWKETEKQRRQILVAELT